MDQGQNEISKLISMKMMALHCMAMLAVVVTEAVGFRFGVGPGFRVMGQFMLDQ